MEAEDIGADEGSGEENVFPERKESSTCEVKPDEADAIISRAMVLGASEAGTVGGDIGAGSGNTEHPKMDYLKPDAEADIRGALLEASRPADEASIDALGGNGSTEDPLKMDYFKPDAKADIRGALLEAGKPATEAGFDALHGDIGNGKMEDEAPHALEVSVGETGQNPCNGNENDAGAATLKVRGGVVSSMANGDATMGALGALGASPSLGADESSGDAISDLESHESRLSCNKIEEQIESMQRMEVTTRKKIQEEMLRTQEKLLCKQNQLLKSEQDQRLKEKQWKLLQFKEEQALKEIETKKLQQIQVMQKMEVTMSRKVTELAQTEDTLDRKYKQLIKNEDEQRLKEKEWELLQCKEKNALKEKERELLEIEEMQSLKEKNLLQFEKDLNTRANDLAMEDTDLKRRQEKLNTTLSESMQIQSNLIHRENELNNREKELEINRHKVQTTYYAAKLGRAIGMNNLRTLMGRDEGSDLILPLVAPKVEEDWNRRHILYDAIFMLFLPLVFCLQGLFASMPSAPSHTVQTWIFYICGFIWMFACLGGLLGIFSKWPKVQVASTYIGRLLFLAFCIMQVGTLWFLVPPSKGSEIAAGTLCGSVILTHFGCWVQDLIENREKADDCDYNIH